LLSPLPGDRVEIEDGTPRNRIPDPHTQSADVRHVHRHIPASPGFFDEGFVRVEDEGGTEAGGLGEQIGCSGQLGELAQIDAGA
jgi:hypothetical protein